MDLSRIAPVIDIEKTAASIITVVGAGGTAGLIGNLTRCGVGQFNLIDFDCVVPSNIARQAHSTDNIGWLKTDAIAAAIRRINPWARVQSIPRNFLEMSDDEIDEQLRDTDLFIFAADQFAVAARGNEVALRFNTPAIWPGLHAGGLSGEIAFWTPEINACYRCLCANRYAAQAQAAARGETLDPVSDGCTIFDVSLLDSIAGMVAIGILTRGSNNRFGRLIEELGDRNFIRVQLDASWQKNHNPIRRRLGISDDCSACFSWIASVERDPDNGNPACPDCEKYRPVGRVHGIPINLNGPSGSDINA